MHATVSASASPRISKLWHRYIGAWPVRVAGLSFCHRLRSHTHMDPDLENVIENVIRQALADALAAVSRRSR